MIRVGVIGLGFMGRIHLQAYRQIDGAEIGGICSPSGRNLNGDFTDITGNIGSDEGFRLDMAQVVGTRDPMVLINDATIDLIDICSPTDTHMEYAVSALRAGKHVVCEKPLARTSIEARRIKEVADSAVGYFLPAMVVRFSPAWDFLKRATLDRRYGKIRCASFRRICESPHWGTDFYLRASRSGGALLDLHIHDVDFIQYCFGPPKLVYATGMTLFSGSFDHVVAQYTFTDSALVYAEAGWGAGHGHGFRSTFTVNFETAMLDYDTARPEAPLILFGESTGREAVTLPVMDGYRAELTHMIECIHKERAPTIVTAGEALKAIEIIEAEERSIRSGEVVRIESNKSS